MTVKRITPRMAYERIAILSENPQFRHQLYFNPGPTIVEVINDLAVERKGEGWTGVYDTGSTVVMKTGELVQAGMYGGIPSKLEGTMRYYRLKIEQIKSGEADEASEEKIEGLRVKIEQVGATIHKLEEALGEAYRDGAWALGELGI